MKWFVLKSLQKESSGCIQIIQMVCFEITFKRDSPFVPLSIVKGKLFKWLKEITKILLRIDK